MKSKKIPEDILRKSIKDAQTEINDIITKLEQEGINLEESMDKYNRMLQLNYHIQEQFRERIKNINSKSFKSKKKTPNKNSGI